MRYVNQLAVTRFMLVLFLVAGISRTCFAGNEPDMLSGERLRINFKSGQAALTTKNRIRLKQFLDKYKLGPDDKIVVIGYTDNKGKKNKNSRLSNMRAEAIKKQLTRRYGVDANKIFTFGRGSQNPVADNSNKKGRAQNRRVEIYLTQVKGDRTKFELIKPNSAAIDQLVKEARDLLRHQKVKQALNLLQKAHAQGGEQFSDWHAVSGIAGYYAGMASVKVMAHLTTALHMDPLNAEAREYYGRVEARQKFESGMINSRMGTTKADPIVCSTETQSHEYLRLFNVKPMSHQLLTTRNIEVWHCRDAQGRLTDYYFDLTGVFDWLLTQQDAGNS